MALDETLVESAKSDLRKHGNAVAIGRKIGLLSNQFGSAREFINWCSQCLGISKAQTYKYKRLHKIFGAYEAKFDFALIPMRLLYEVTENSCVLGELIARIDAKAPIDVEWLETALGVDRKKPQRNQNDDIDFLIAEIVRVEEEYRKLVRENDDLKTRIGKIGKLCKSNL
jgi:hypothetical protein